MPGQTVDVEHFDLFDGELIGIRAQHDNQPTLEISYDDLIDPVEVYFNNELLGMLDPGLTFKEFNVPEHLIFLEHNEVRIHNAGIHDFLLREKEFSTGAIDLISVVPEPGTSALMLLGLAGFSLLVWRGTRARQRA